MKTEKIEENGMNERNTNDVNKIDEGVLTEVKQETLIEGECEVMGNCSNVSERISEQTAEVNCISVAEITIQENNQPETVGGGEEVLIDTLNPASSPQDSTNIGKFFFLLLIFTNYKVV